MPFRWPSVSATEGSRYVGASVSENGTLVYGQAGADVARQLTWFDRTGRELGTLGDAAPYSGLALSPDERRVAVTLETGSSRKRRHLADRYRPESDPA